MLITKRQYFFSDPSNTSSDRSREKTGALSKMHNTNEGRSQAIATEINANNIILLRGTKSSENGHILLRNDILKTNLVVEDGDTKLGQVRVGFVAPFVELSCHFKAEIRNKQVVKI